MAAMVSIGTIAIGGSSNCTGIFSGQNMQNNWDSHAPNISSLGTMMGTWNYTNVYLARLDNQSVFNQPIYDQDSKTNASPMWMGL